MFALNPEVLRMGIGVSSLQNLGHEDGHLDDLDYVNGHARVLLGHQVVILIFGMEEAISHARHDRDQTATWIFFYMSMSNVRTDDRVHILPIIASWRPRPISPIVISTG